MIRYRVAFRGREGEVALDVDNVTVTGPVVVEGEPSLRTEIASRLLEASRSSPDRLGAVDAGRLAEWMAAPGLAELEPRLLEGAAILRHGGTYARQDCATAALFLGERLAMLAKLEARAIDRSWPAWNEHVENAVAASALELRAWEQHCALSPEQEAALSRVISRELLAGEPSHYTAAMVLEAFRAAVAAGEPAEVLADFWQTLETLAAAQR